MSQTNECPMCGETKVRTRVMWKEIHEYENIDDQGNSENEVVIERDLDSESAPYCAGCGEPR